MKLYTHTDMDGVVSAMLLSEIFDITIIEFTEPALIQKEIVCPSESDIVADLPRGASLNWYDHHPLQEDFVMNIGKYDPDAKSCARVIFEMYKDKLKRFENLVNITDRIDSAEYTKEDITNPGPMNKLAIAIRSGDMVSDNEFRKHLIVMLAIHTPEQLMEDHLIKKRVEDKLALWKEQQTEAEKNLVIENNVAVIDVVSYGDKYPIYQLFNLYVKHPEIMFVITARTDKNNSVKLSAGCNIFRKDEFNGHIGSIMRKYEGGGHKGIGGCNVPLNSYKSAINAIKKRLIQ